jgi:hypothetical protein
MKRKQTTTEGCYLGTRTKKSLVEINEEKWVSPSDIKNYMIHDTLVDWLKLTKTSEEKPSVYTPYLFSQGIDFEKNLVQYINNHKLEVVYISNQITDKTCLETINEMKKGTPLIYSAPFKNKKNFTHGIIDLLVRSDCLDYICEENILSEKDKFFHGSNLSGDYNYVVVDIKFSTLPLRSDGKHLLNSGFYPAYKGQLYIYNEAVSDIQGFQSRYAFILGRRSKYTQKGETFLSLNCLDKFGVVDFKGVDRDYKFLTLDAIKWVRELYLNGKKWSATPPTRRELYPNMSVDSGIWNVEKQKIADQIADITQIWYCGVKNRSHALRYGIKSWQDKRCNSKTLGVKGKRAKIVDQIISINQQKNDKIRPNRIKNNIFNWRNCDNELFVDFETIGDFFGGFDNLPWQHKKDMIFMIGVYYKDNQTWNYKNFICLENSKEEEYKIMNDFANFVHEQGNPKLWFWHADQMIWNRRENVLTNYFCQTENGADKVKNIVTKWKFEGWRDLCYFFRSEPIVIKDCFKYGLKDIYIAMKKHNMITISLDGVCQDGNSASMIAWLIYQNRENDADKDREYNMSKLKEEMTHIIKYNIFDVQVLFEILNYLRQKH